MFCPNCAHDKFRVFDVVRERRFIEGRGWVINVDCDTRFIRCKKCGHVYLQELKIVFEEVAGDKIKIKKVSKSFFEEQQLFN